jgi:hypothetical protein
MDNLKINTICQRLFPGLTIGRFYPYFYILFNLVYSVSVLPFYTIYLSKTLFTFTEVDNFFSNPEIPPHLLII